MLYKIEVRHIGPKDSHASVEAWALADSEAQVLAHVAAAAYHDDGDDDEDIYIDASEVDDLDAFKARAVALEIAIAVNEWGDIEATASPIALDALMRGTGWSGTEDAYYGVTHYWWGDGEDIDDATAETLLRLGIATDLRAVGGDQ